MYTNLVRPTLFALSKNDAERAHLMTIRALRVLQNAPGFLKLIEQTYAIRAQERPVTVAGIAFPNRVGLAAGLDKQAELLPFWQALGFGFVEIGSVLPRWQSGNPRPRMFRIPERDALRNRMGFNSEGAYRVSDRFNQVARRTHIPVGISLGKMKDTPLDDAANDYVTTLPYFALSGAFYVVNVSSPNTPGLRKLQGRDYLEALILAVVQKEAYLASIQKRPTKPVFVKVAPDLTEEELAIIIEAVLRSGGRGIVAGNTTIQTPEGIRVKSDGQPTGGFSGPFLYERMCQQVRFIRREAGNLAIIACGGITNGERALLALNSGADLVEVLTALIYKGPGLVRELRAALQ